MVKWIFLKEYQTTALLPCFLSHLKYNSFLYHIPGSPTLTSIITNLSSNTLFQPTSFLLFLGHATVVPASGIRCSLSRSSYHEFLLKWCSLKESFLISPHPRHSLPLQHFISCRALVMNSSLLPILECKFPEGRELDHFVHCSILCSIDINWTN